MDTLLITVTGLSLAMAIGMGFVVAKLLREEHQRSDARVAALTGMAAVQVDDLEIRPANGTVTGVGELFTAGQPRSVPRAQLLAVGALAIVAVVLLLGLKSSGVRGDSAAAAGAPPAESVAAGAPSLELLSLHHTQHTRSIVITGHVQNPRGSTPLTHVVATAMVFGVDGTVLSSARAPVDFTTMAPGDESPFVVTVPVLGEVTRYRIGFRSADDRVIAHVDRRTPEGFAGR